MSFEDPYIKSIDCSSCKCHSSAPCSIAIILTFKIGEICTISTSFPQNDLLLSSGTLNPRVRVRRERTGMPFPFFFYTTGTSFQSFFSVTPIVNCNFLWKSRSFGYKADSLAIQSATVR